MRCDAVGVLGRGCDAVGWVLAGGCDASGCERQFKEVFWEADVMQ